MTNTDVPPLTDAELAARFGTPLYAHDRGALEAAAADLRALLPAPATLYFSLKANPAPHVGRVLRDAGCRAEISSPGELDSALTAGFDPAGMLYTGPGKTDVEIGGALCAGVREFSCESIADLRRVAALAAANGLTARVLLRVNPPAAHGDSGMRMTGSPTQFGIDVDGPPIDRTDLKVPGARVVGFHFFPVSNAVDEDVLVEEMTASARHAAELARDWGVALEVVDLGGGFAAPYAAPGTRPAYPGLRERVEPALDQHLPGWRDGSVRVCFESGRYLTCDSGRLIARVTDVKSSHGRRFVVTDTGIHHVGGLSGVGRALPMRASVTGGAAAGAGAPGDPSVVQASVVGPLCTPADVLNRNLEIGAVAAGDLITIPNVGAYGVTASLMGFLSRPAPAEVLVDGRDVVAASRIITTREDLIMSENTTAQNTIAETAATTAGAVGTDWDADFERMLREVTPSLDGAEPITGAHTLRSLGVDSLALVHLLTAVESHYGVTIPDEALVDGRCDTVEGMWSLVRPGA